jgi:Raf kinase inhibitor-like YbhB/YbcL family protein
MRYINAILFFFFCAAAAAASVFTLTSPDLPAGKDWDSRFVLNVGGCTGGNVSPTLAWHGAPAGTKSFVVMMYDPATPPDSGWWHWIVYDLPASASGLPAGAGSPGSTLLPGGAKQGKPDGDAPEARYYGPCPDAGDKPHRYRITLYALKIDHLDIPPTATAADINALAIVNALATASIIRPYRR